jgi:hypothetical protein
MLIKGKRGTEGLSDHQITQCKIIWEVLGGKDLCLLDCSEANTHGSKTKFNQTKNKVILGADVIPGSSLDPRSRMSEMACLAHEMAHAERFSFGLDRDIQIPHKLRDEAETSLHASWNMALNKTDRITLIEDARDLLDEWLKGE